jgi:hypothetical protein
LFWAVPHSAKRIVLLREKYRACETFPFNRAFKKAPQNAGSIYQEIDDNQFDRLQKKRDSLSSAARAV